MPIEKNINLFKTEMKAHDTALCHHGHPYKSGTANLGHLQDTK